MVARHTKVVFPSYMAHSVYPVVKGERRALVAWIRGRIKDGLLAEAMGAHLRAIQDWVEQPEDTCVYGLLIFFQDTGSWKLLAHRSQAKKTAGTPAALVPAPLGLRRIYGSHLLQTGRPKEAAEVLRRVALEDGGPGVRSASAAEDALLYAVRLRPEDGEVQANLGRFFYLHGRPALGTYHLAQAVRLWHRSRQEPNALSARHTGQERAVKAIEIRGVKNPTRFQREIHIAKKLDHPNVVRLYETFKDAKKIYLVMELCTGGELFDRIVDEAPSGFDEHHAAKYIRQILSAICYLHAHRFAHRDVKPENFLFHDASPESQLKIIDFGLACQFEPGAKMNTKAGTAYYVAPEVLKGEYDEKCDVWSAGVISFVLLCGYPPFAGDKDPEILKKVKSGSFEFRSPECPRDAAEVPRVLSLSQTQQWRAALYALQWPPKVVLYNSTISACGKSQAMQLLAQMQVQQIEADELTLNTLMSTLQWQQLWSLMECMYEKESLNSFGAELA
eukprot:g4370.t1